MNVIAPAASQVAQLAHSKTIGWGTALMNFGISLVDGIDPVIRAIAGLAGIALTLALTRVHIKNGDKAELEMRLLRQRLGEEGEG